MRCAVVHSLRGPGTFVTACPPRLLEDPDGIVRLYNCEEALAYARNAVVTCGEEGGVEYLRWCLPELTFGHALARKRLYGSLASLVGPRYLVLKAQITPKQAPIQRLRGLVLVEPFAASVEELARFTGRILTQ